MSSGQADVPATVVLDDSHLDADCVDELARRLADEHRLNRLRVDAGDG